HGASMSQTAVLVWLSASAAFGSAGSGLGALPTFNADLAGFAHSRLLRLGAPRENSAAFRASAYAPDVVAEIESSLEEARNGSASLEQNLALSALERADQLLRAHPELPQSAWLMAELLELSAEVEDTEGDGADAALAMRKRAAALEGPRAAPFSDRAARLELEAPNAAPLSVGGLEASDHLEWDGNERGSAVTTAAGEHHARVLRNGRLVWAGWVKIEARQAQLRLPVPETIPCSGDDLVGSRFEAGRAVPAAHARCDSYVLARARLGGGVEVALCERNRCGSVVIWERPSPTAVSTEARKPVWPYAVAVGAGALALTGFVLWRAGAFDRPGAPTVTSVVYNPKQSQMGLRF
ncbi:MAG: hypothetical protein ABJB12_18145, partial [Pseudomonadota bacterium]